MKLTQLVISSIFASESLCVSASAQVATSSQTTMNNAASLAQGDYFDFDSQSESDRANADLRYAKGPANSGGYLEPLNGAGLGVLKLGDKYYEACSAFSEELKATRISLEKVDSNSTICTRTSEDQVGVFRLVETPVQNAPQISLRYAVWPMPNPVPAAPQGEEVLSNPNRVLTAAPAPENSLTFNVPVTMTNLMPDVARFRVTCATWDENAAAAGSNPWTPANSSSQTIPVKAREELNRTVSVKIDYPPNYDFSGIESYSCNLAIAKSSGVFTGPFPQFPKSWDDADIWKVARGADFTEEIQGQTWAYSGEPLDAVAAIRSNGKQVAARPVTFNGMALPSGVLVQDGGPPVEENASPDFGDVIAAENTQELSCPTADESQVCEFRLRERNQ